MWMGFGFCETCQEAERMRKHDGKRAAIAYGLAAVAWMGVLFWFSGQSGAESGELSSKLALWLFDGLLKRGVDFDALHIFLRKLAHFGAFAVEGWLMGSAFLCILPKKWAAIITGIACTSAAVLNELHQTLSEGRSCEVRDMLIDTAGAMLGFAFAVVVLHAFSKLQKNKHNR